MGSPVPAALLHRFSSAKARPVVVSEYTAQHGWVQPHRRVVLTSAVAYSLMIRDVTMVKVRWRLRTVEFSLTPLRPHVTEYQH